MPRNAFPITAAAALAMTAAAPAQSAPAPVAFPFDAAVAFGDSLSDAGNISILQGDPQPMRYTTNPGRTGLEDLAAGYGLALSASLAGGTDFAYGGAGVITNSPGTPAAIPTLTAQVDGYLAQNPALDPHTLYAVLGGANDIFSAETSTVAGGIAQSLIASATAGESPAQARATARAIDAAVEKAAGVSRLYGFGTATTVIGRAARTEAGLIGRLQGAGARNIVVINLPDIGLTPEASSEGAAVAAQLTQLSTTFNTQLDSAIAAHPRGVIPVDAFDLIRAVLAQPDAYGFANSTVPACTVSSSLACTPQTLRAPDAASTYVFADGVHPTTATHALLAQVIASEIAAPAHISLLSEAPLAASATQRSVLGEELALDSSGAATRGRAFARVDYDSQSFRGGPLSADAGADGATETLGFDLRPAPRLSLGAAFTGAQSFTAFDDRYAKFRAETAMASVFAQYRLLGAGYVSAQAGGGRLDFDDVSRAFDIGPARHGERGSTDGAIFTAALTAGWWFGAGPLRIGPYAQLAYDHVHVGGYAEAGDDATAMTFGPQSREAVVGEFGLRGQGSFHTPWGEVRPYAQVAYDHDGRAAPRAVDAGLVDMAGEFSIPGFAPAGDWATADAGLEWRFAPAWSATVGYQGRFADRSQALDAATVGVRRSF